MSLSQRVAYTLFLTLPALAQSHDPWEKFWQSASPSEADRAAQEILKTAPTFDQALKILRQGRPYSAQKTGVVFLHNRTQDGIEHNFAVNIPPSYDPKKKYQLRFQLHGGVGGRSDNKPRGNGEIGALAGAEQIYVLPYAWDDAPWWSDDQVQNLAAIVDAVKRTYNVDENRVAVAGVSDGATGLYYIATRDTTPYASFLPLNGFIMVLANTDIDDGRIYPANLRNKPLFVINGGRDRLYPISEVERYTRHLMTSGVSIEYHPQPEGEHNTRWWPEMKDPFEQFVTSHPRDPHPAKLSWEAANSAHSRAHWLILDDFAQADTRALPDINLVSPSEQPFYAESGGSLFPRRKPSGRVDLVRTGNTVEATTRGVSTFTLLLSSDAFNLDQPIRVVANGKEVFNAKVERNVKTLLKWAAKDNDRTMLYAAELKIKLK